MLVKIKPILSTGVSMSVSYSDLSIISYNCYKVDIDWKKQTFTGLKNPENKVQGLQVGVHIFCLLETLSHGETFFNNHNAHLKNIFNDFFTNNFIQLSMYLHFYTVNP